MARGVLVTGASSGIGEASALELDRRGFRVFAGVRRDEDAEAIGHAGSERLSPVMLDVTDADAVARARETIERDLGGEPLAGIVNNAGVGVSGPLETLDLDDLRRQFEINTVAPVAVTQAFLPALRASRERVVNMSSVGGRVGQPFLGPYSASKFALEALSDVMRRELLPGGSASRSSSPATSRRGSGRRAPRMWRRSGRRRAKRSCACTARAWTGWRRS